MPDSNVQPSETNFLTPNDFNDFLIGQHLAANGSNGPWRTSASVSGVPQYGATTFTLSDILQGTYAGSDNTADTLLLVNKALTQDLSSLFQTGADGLSSFSTVPISPTLNADIKNGTGSSTTGGSSTSGGGTTGGMTSGGLVDKAWVEKLPLEHPTTKALLWVRNGKGSREMHLPTSESIQTDINQHKQHKEMKAEWQHPWNMDRQGGGIGGEATIYYHVEDAGTILGEDVNTPGQRGAFGYLDPTDEQYYISMAWPYPGGAESFRKAGRDDIAQIAESLNQSAYRGKKILVYSIQTQKACVCTPGDWGPQPYWSNGSKTRSSINGFYAGLAPDVHYVLGTDHGADFVFGWVDDDTPVGPYVGTGSSSTGGAIIRGTTRITANLPRTGPGIKASAYVNLALQQRGKAYVFNTGSITDPDPATFDCSGLVYWCAMTLGYIPPEGVSSDWSFSGTIIQMMKDAGTILSIEDGIAVPGAILARAPNANGAGGHVAISLGDGNVMEASSPKNGVNVFSATASYRSWTDAGWLPGMVFDNLPEILSNRGEQW